MAEILIRATNTVLPDQAKADNRAYRRGDIVEVRPNGAYWARNELSNPDNDRALFVVKIPDVTVAQCRKFLNHWEDDFDGVMHSKRRFRVVLDDVPQGIRNTLRDQGYVQLLWGQVKGFIEDKATLQREV